MLVGISTFGSDDLQGGLGRYAHCLLHAMEEVAPRDWIFEALVRGEKERSLVPAHSAWSTFRSPAIVYGDIRSIVWHQAILPAFIRQREYDVVLLLAASRRIPWPFLVRLMGGAPMVGVVHDLAAVHVPGKYGLLRDTYALRVLPALMRGLDDVIAISECTKRDLVEHARVEESRIAVVPLGLDQSLFTPGDRELARESLAKEFALHSPYLLYAARMEHPGKNHLRLIRTFARLRQQLGIPHRLVLVGKECQDDPIGEAIRKAGEAVISLGFVSDSSLVNLYRGATGVVFPSLYEGFGLPVLEAMACGVPVACSYVASLPEVAGDAAIYFDPMNEVEMERAMEALLDPSKTASMRQRGIERSREFTWEKSAAMTLEVLERTAVRCRR
jgi:glycosyltransferase involved in cell wall biosynthesis